MRIKIYPNWPIAHSSNKRDEIYGGCREWLLDLVKAHPKVKGNVYIRAKRPIRPELIPVSLAWSNWEYFYSLLDRMLVHRRVTPSIKFTGTHLYTWVERGTVRVKCLAQEHNTMSPARAWTQTTRSRDERTNHEATAPPTSPPNCKYKNWFLCTLLHEFVITVKHLFS